VVGGELEVRQQASVILQLASQQEEAVIMMGVGEVEVGAVGSESGDGVRKVVAEVVLEFLPQLQRIADRAVVKDKREEGTQPAAGGPG
jgi:hypothetical protein